MINQVTKNGEIKTRQIFTPYNPPKFEKSKSGHGHIQKVHKWVWNKEKGIQEWKQVGTTNLDKIIQENNKMNDLEAIQKQFLAGNKAVLEAKQGIYCDISQMPNNIHEAAAMSEKLRSIYKNNPVLKEIYKTENEYQEAFLKNKVIPDVENWNKKKMDELKLAEEKAYKTKVQKEAQFKNDVEKATKGEQK